MIHLRISQNCIGRRYIDFFIKHKYYLLLCIASLLPLSWFDNNRFIAGGDILPQFYPHMDIYRAFYVWDYLINNGNYSVFPSIIYPYLTFWWVFGQIFSILTVQKLWFISLFLVTGIGSYSLALYVFNDHSYKDVIAVTCSLFYLFNPFILVNYSLLQNSIILAYAIFPIFFFIIYEIFR